MFSTRRLALFLISSGILVTAVGCDSEARHGTAAAASDRLQTLPSAPIADSAASAQFALVAPAPAAPSRKIAAGARTAGEQVPSPAAIEREVTPGSMLVRTGEASLQVDSLEIGVARIRDVARRTSAVIANTEMQDGRNETRAATIQLRVPSEHFDEAVSGLSPIGKLESVNVSVQDVGEEFVDVQARMVNARRLEQRLIELLASRTGKLSDVLAVERELARVREEIERNEGRLRYLRTRASVSTLTVAVHEPYPMVADHPGARPMRDAFVQAWRNLVSVTATMIASLGALIPIGIIAGMVILIFRRTPPVRAFLHRPVARADKT
jgi:hypothetical protein